MNAKNKGLEKEENQLNPHQFPDPVEDYVNEFPADCVVTTGVVVGSILLAGDQLLGVEELAVGSGTDLICNGNRTMLVNNIVFTI